MALIDLKAEKELFLLKLETVCAENILVSVLVCITLQMPLNVMKFSHFSSVKPEICLHHRIEYPKLAREWHLKVFMHICSAMVVELQNIFAHEFLPQGPGLCSLFAQWWGFGPINPIWTGICKTRSDRGRNTPPS